MSIWVLISVGLLGGYQNPVDDFGGGGLLKFDGRF